MDKLKPCPFCGANLSMIFTEIDENEIWHSTANCLNILECGVSIDTVGASREEAEAALIARWNRRANNG